MLQAPATPEDSCRTRHPASAEQFLGNAAAAQLHYEHAVRLQPEFYRAWWALSELEKNKPPTGRLDALLALYDKAAPAPENRLYLGHAVSRELEKVGDYDEAFRFLRQGKEGMRRKIAYQPDFDRALFRWVNYRILRGR